MLVISPYARQNHVDSNVTDQTSVINFVEYNWRLSSISGAADQLLSRFDRAEGIPFDLAGSFQFRDERYRRLILDPGSGAAHRGH